MKKDVIVELVDRHEIDGESEGARIVSVATIEGDDDDYTIIYPETGEMEGCVVNLNVKGGKTVTMTRTGDSFSAQMIMQQGKRHTCFYNTPAGELMLGVYTRNVSSNIKDGVGVLKFSYVLDFNSDLVSENELTITVKES